MQKYERLVLIIQFMIPGVYGKTRSGSIREYVSIWRGLDDAASEIPIEAIHSPRAVLLPQACM